VRGGAHHDRLIFGVQAIPVVAGDDAPVIETDMLDPLVEVADDLFSRRLIVASASSQILDPFCAGSRSGEVEDGTMRARKNLIAWKRREPSAAERLAGSKWLGELDKSGEDGRQLAANGGLVRIRSRPAIVELFNGSPRRAKANRPCDRTRAGESSSNQTAAHIEACGEVATVSRAALDLHDDASSILEVEPEHASDAGNIEAQTRNTAVELRATKRCNHRSDCRRISRSPNRFFNHGLKIARLLLGNCAGKLVT
jgi:hypothetical protein